MKMHQLLNLVLSICILAMGVREADSGVLTCTAGIAYYGTCQTACNTGYAACMTASGLVAGTTGPVGWWAWLTSAAAGCSAVQGACMATCFSTAAGMCAAPAP